MCCKECFVPSLDRLMPPDYMLAEAMPEACKDEECECHTPAEIFEITNQ